MKMMRFRQTGSRSAFTRLTPQDGRRILSYASNTYSSIIHPCLNLFKKQSAQAMPKLTCIKASKQCMHLFVYIVWTVSISFHVLLATHVHKGSTTICCRDRTPFFIATSLKRTA